MITSEIAKRYAQALFDIAAEENNYAQYDKDLKLFSAILRDNASLGEFFANPVFDRDEKKAVLGEILAKTDISQTTANFLKLLAEKGRIGLIGEIQAYFEELMDGVMKKARVLVRSAFPVKDDLQARLKSTLEKMTGKDVEMVIEEDRSLLGGIVIKVGDTVYDGSVKAQLNTIRELLREEK